jgi:hypothetical protein
LEAKLHVWACHAVFVVKNAIVMPTAAILKLYHLQDGDRCHRTTQLLFMRAYEFAYYSITRQVYRILLQDIK